MARDIEEENKRLLEEFLAWKAENALGEFRSYSEREIEVGMIVAVRSGKGQATTWAECKVTNIAVWQLAAPRSFRVERLDGGKALGVQNADDIFPIQIIEAIKKAAEKA